MNHAKVFTALILWFLSAGASAQAFFEYALFYENKYVGDLSIQYSSGDEGSYIVEQKYQIKSKGFFGIGGMELKNTLVETYTDNGLLLRADNKLIERSKLFWTLSELSRDEYLVFRAQLKNEQEKEEEEFIELVKDVAAHLVPGAGEVFAIGELILSDGHEAVVGTRFPRDGFDTTFLGIPYLWRNLGYMLPDSMHIFDTEEMHIYFADIEYQGEEYHSIDGAVVTSHHYTLKTSGTDLTDIKIASADSGEPYFLEVLGNSYRVLLTAKQAVILSSVLE